MFSKLIKALLSTSIAAKLIDMYIAKQSSIKKAQHFFDWHRRGYFLSCINIIYDKIKKIKEEFLWQEI